MPVGSESILLRWPERQMPLKVHLPRPPDGLFEDPDAIFDSVRDGVLDWTDVAAPGVPSFVFVEDKGDADIPIVWAAEPDGGWYIAFCALRAESLVETPRRQPHPRHGALGRRARRGSSRRPRHAAPRDGPRARPRRPQPRSDSDVMARRRAGSATGLSQRDRTTLQMLYARPIGTRILGAKRDR